MELYSIFILSLLAIAAGILYKRFIPLVVNKRSIVLNIGSTSSASPNDKKKEGSGKRNLFLSPNKITANLDEDDVTIVKKFVRNSQGMRPFATREDPFVASPYKPVLKQEKESSIVVSNYSLSNENIKSVANSSIKDIVASWPVIYAESKPLVVEELDESFTLFEKRRNLAEKELYEYNQKSLENQKLSLSRNSFNIQLAKHAYARECAEEIARKKAEQDRIEEEKRKKEEKERLEKREKERLEREEKEKLEREEKEKLEREEKEKIEREKKEKIERETIDIQINNKQPTAAPEAVEEKVDIPKKFNSELLAKFEKMKQQALLFDGIKDKEISNKVKNLKIKVPLQTAVQQLANNEESVRIVIQKLCVILKTAKEHSLDAFYYSLMKLFSCIIEQVEIRRAGQNPEMSSCFSILLLGLLSNLDSKNSIRDFFLVYISESCPYIYIPGMDIQYIDKSKFENDIVSYRIACGYKKVEKSDENPIGLEPDDKYFERMTGFVYLMGGIMQCTRLKVVDHPYSIRLAWSWLATICNSEPRSITPTILLAILRMCSYQLLVHYGVNFRRFLNFIRTDYLPRCENVCNREHANFQMKCKALKIWLNDLGNLDTCKIEPVAAIPESA